MTDKATFIVQHAPTKITAEERISGCTSKIVISLDSRNLQPTPKECNT